MSRFDDMHELIDGIKPTRRERRMLRKARRKAEKKEQKLKTFKPRVIYHIGQCKGCKAPMDEYLDGDLCYTCRAMNRLGGPAA